jgi:filamentous hemagglutinin family protein
MCFKDILRFSFAVLFLTSHLLYSSAVYAQISTSGTSSTRTNFSQNGTPVVSIANPKNGVSANFFNQFNVDERGVIVNNSLKNGVSVIGGAITANRNLSQNADLILIETTSGNRTNLSGFTEIFGKKSDLIIANLNGITCDGCGFVNTARLSLATGTSLFDQSGNYLGVVVNGGDVTITPKGLNGNFTDYVSIITRAAKIQGEINAPNIDIITGNNQVDQDNNITKLVASGADSARPEHAIDSSALGGMYADRIRLVANEGGVGVKLRGGISGLGDIKISANGKLVTANNSIVAGEDIQVTSQSLEARGGAIVANDNVNIAVTDNIKLEGQLLNSGKSLKLTSGNDTQITGSLVNATADIEVQASKLSASKSQISATNNIAINAQTRLTDNSSIIATNNIEITGDLSGGLTYSGKHGKYAGDLRDTAILADGGVDVKSTNINDTDISAIANSSIEANAINNLSLDVDDDVLLKVDTATLNNLDIKGKMTANANDLAIDSSLVNEIDITNTKSFAFVASVLGSGLDIINSATLQNSQVDGDVSNQGNATIDRVVIAGDLDNYGTASIVASATPLLLNNLTNRGTISFSGLLSVAVTSFINHGDIKGGALDIVANEFVSSGLVDLQSFIAVAANSIHAKDIKASDALLRSVADTNISSGAEINISGDMAIIATDTSILSSNVNISGIFEIFSEDGTKLVDSIIASREFIVNSVGKLEVSNSQLDTNNTQLLSDGSLLTNSSSIQAADGLLLDGKTNLDLLDISFKAKSINLLSLGDIEISNDAGNSILAGNLLKVIGDNITFDSVYNQGAALTLSAESLLTSNQLLKATDLTILADNIALPELKFLASGDLNLEIRNGLNGGVLNNIVAGNNLTIVTEGVDFSLTNKNFNLLEGFNLITTGDIEFNNVDINAQGGITLSGNQVDIGTTHTTRGYGNRGRPNFEYHETHDKSVFNAEVISIFAVTDLLLQSIEFIANGNVELHSTEGRTGLTAARNVTDKHTRGKRTYNILDVITNLTNKISGDNINITADQGVDITVADVDASNDYNAYTQEGDFTTTAPNDFYYYEYYKKKKKWYGSSKTTHRKKRKISPVVTGFNVAGDTTIYANNGEIDVTATNINSNDGNVTLYAKDDVSLNAAEGKEYRLSYTKKSGFGGLKSSLRESVSDKIYNVGSTISTKGLVNIISDAGDINLEAVTIEGAGINLEADNINIKNLVDYELSYEEYRKNSFLDFGINSDGITYASAEIAKDANTSLRSVANVLRSGSDIFFNAEGSILGENLVAIANRDIKFVAGKDIQLTPGYQFADTRKLRERFEHSFNWDFSDLSMTLDTGFHYNSEKLSDIATDIISNQILAQQNIEFASGGDINIISSDIIAENLLQEAKGDITYDVRHNERRTKTTTNTAFLGVELYLDLGVVKQIPDMLKSLGEALKPSQMTAMLQMPSILADLVSGDSLDEALEGNEEGLNRLSETLDTYNQISSGAGNAGAGLDVVGRLQHSKQEHYSSTAVNNNVVVGNADFSSDNANFTGTQVEAENNINLDIDNNLNINASTDNSTDKSKAYGGEARYGIITGNFSLNDNYSKSKYESESHNNSKFIAKGDINLNAKNLNIDGGNIEGENVNLNIAENLAIKSRQNATKGKHLSLQAGSSTGDNSSGVNASLTLGKESKQRVEDTSAIEARNNLTGTVGGDAKLTGAVVHGDTTTNLQVAGSTILEDIKNKHKRREITIGGGYQEGTTQNTTRSTQDDGKTSYNASFDYSSKDYESTTRAGIGLASKDAEIVHKDINVKPISVKAQYDSEDGFIRPVDDFKYGLLDHAMPWRATSRGITDIASGLGAESIIDPVNKASDTLTGYALSTATSLFTGGDASRTTSVVSDVQDVREDTNRTYALNNATALSADDLGIAIDQSAQILDADSGLLTFNPNFSEGFAYNGSAYINLAKTDISDHNLLVDVLFHESFHASNTSEIEADARLYGKVSSLEWGYQNWLNNSVTGAGESMDSWLNQNINSPAITDTYNIDPNTAEHWAVAFVKEVSKRAIIPAAKWTGKKVVQGTKWAYNKITGNANKIQKPNGIPKNWLEKASKKSEGKQFINPKNPHDRVRVMPSNAKSPNPAQQKPYVKRQINGKFYDKNGNIVSGKSPESHIPLKNFKF